MSIASQAGLPASLEPDAARDRYVVIGNPVSHSQSPLIHARFALQTSEPVDYGRLLAPVDGFDEAVRAFIESGGRGLNVTVPFKLDAFRFAARHSTRASAAGAVNTLKVLDDGSVFGDNTDGVGLVNDLERNLDVPLAGKRVLLLGAGGAARGVVLPLVEAGVREIVIVNRTASKAVELAQAFASMPVEEGMSVIDAPTIRRRILGGDPEVAVGAFDVVVNATAGSLGGEVPAFDPAVLDAGTLAYDMMYAAEPTVFMQLAHARGARAADGIGMLVEQAAESFFIWRGVRPDTAPVLEALRAMRATPPAAHP